MALIAKLDILLGAKTGTASRKFKQFQRTTDGFASSILRGTRRIIGFGGALTALAAGGGMAFMIKSQLEAVDATAKLSDQLGISTEALIGLRHAADLTGAGAESLDAGLGTLSKRLGEATRDSGAAIAALGELKLEMEDIIKLSPEEQFFAIADAMETIEEPIRRNAIAANLFSKANQQLLNTLALGRDGLESAADAAERLGITFSRDAARGVEEANDAIDAFQKSLKGVFTQAAIQIAPFIKVFADDLTGAVVSAKDALDETATSTNAAAQEFGVLGAAILVSADAIQEFQKNWLAFQVVIREARTGVLMVSDILPGLGRTPERIEEMNRGLERMKARLAELEGAPDFSKTLVDRIRNNFAAISEFTIEPILDVEEFEIDGIADSTEAVDALAAAMTRAQAIFNNTRTPIEEFNIGLAEAGELLEADRITLETYNRQLDLLQQKLQGTNASKSFDATLVGSEKYLEAIDQFSRTVANPRAGAFDPADEVRRMNNFGGDGPEEGEEKQVTLLQQLIATTTQHLGDMLTELRRLNKPKVLKL